MGASFSNGAVESVRLVDPEPTARWEDDDVDRVHKYETIPIDEEGFCTCHGMDAIGRGRPRKVLNNGTN